VAFLDYLADPSTRDVLIQQTLEHVVLVVVPLLLALTVSLGLGIAAHRVPRLRAPILTTVSTFLTIPSLALFALFLPIMGIGDGAVMVALTLYALLPIVRNTVTGLAQVDPAIVRSATGMGMGRVQGLVRVELPLAFPVILSGIRIAAVLTVGIAAIAAYVGGPGLGSEIFGGLSAIGSARGVPQALVGTLAIVLVTVIVDAVVAASGRLLTPKGIR
jgi:osmoprotectant transport system permease protein